MPMTQRKVIAYCPQTSNKTTVLDYAQTQGLSDIDFIPALDTDLAQVKQGDVVIVDNVATLVPTLFFLLSHTLPNSL